MNHNEYVKIVKNSNCAVLLVHGIAGTPRHFDWLIPHIPSNWSVYNILLDGHGGSVTDFSRTSMKKWKQQVDSCLQALSQEHNSIIVVGYSMGTLLTMRLTDKYPQIKGMLLLNSPLKVFVKPVTVWQATKFAFSKVNENDIHELASYNDISVKFEPWLWKYLGWIPRITELLILCKSCRPLAPNLQIPCYVQQGKLDDVVSVKSEKYFLHNPNINCKVYDFTGHSYYEPEFKEDAITNLQNLINQCSITKVTAKAS